MVQTYIVIVTIMDQKMGVVVVLMGTLAITANCVEGVITRGLVMAILK